MFQCTYKINIKGRGLSKLNLMAYYRLPRKMNKNV